MSALRPVTCTRPERQTGLPTPHTHDGDRVTVDAGESGLLISGTAVPLAA
jgi:hypothetical protein